MEEPRDILTKLTGHLIMVLEPLREAFSDEERFKGFLYGLGWDVNGLPQEYVNLSVSVANAIITLEDLTDGEIGTSEISTLVANSRNLFESIQGISTAPPGVNSVEFLDEIGERLFEFLLTRYLSENLPATYNFLSSLNVIEVENIGPSSNKHAYTRTKFKWSEIPNILIDPLAVVKQVYGWGTNELDTQNIFGHLSGFLYALGFTVDLLKPDEELILEYNDTEELGFSRETYGLKFPFYYNFIGDVPVELAIDILELPPQTGKLPGLIVQPRIPSEIPFKFKFGDEVDLKVKVGTELGSKFGVLIRPDGIDAKYPFQDGTNLPSAGFGFTIDYHPPEPKLLIGSPEGIRLEMKGADMGLEIFSESGAFEIKALSEVKELALVLSAGNGDGFLSKILGEGEIKVDIPLGIDWSSKTGFGFRGSMNFEIAVHPHLSLGFIEISQFQLSAGISNSGPEPQLKVESSINVNGDLGPLKVVVEEFGLGLYAKFEPGNLGPMDLDIGFKPPNGVGLSVDAGVVKGGGYLFFDFDNEEYAGALELTFAEFLSLKAIGLITTKMPDGSDGFSMIIIITAEFTIQLGFGFVFLGAGGLLGLHRTMKLEPLAEGVRTGATSGILFPTNVVENAPKIISDLKVFFPVEEGKFLIGPMVKLGWGTPTLISISLGIIIEIRVNNGGGIERIAILGVLKCILPDEEAALLVLQVSFIGAIDFQKKNAFFFASIFESRVLFITIEGEMGVLVAWGDDSNFVVSVGGFHPRFNPPPLPFPVPKRVALNILNESWGKIRVEGYFAVTTNTVQLGCKLELYFGFSEFKIEGHLAFDALFQFDPFYFIIEISGKVSLKVFGFDLFTISLKFSLEGTSPWRATGYGKLKILFFSFKAKFDKTWGDSKNTKLPPISIIPLLEAELQNIQNWQALEPASTSGLLVSLREVPDSDDSIALHPVGTLRVSQRALPLKIHLDKFGSKKPDDANKLEVEVSGPLQKISDIKESFARAQFQEMKDSKKLSSPAYEKEDGGLELSVTGDQTRFGKITVRHVRYELITIDTAYKRRRRRFFNWSQRLFVHFFANSAVRRVSVSHRVKKEFQPFDEKIDVRAGAYTVAFNKDNKPFNKDATNFESMARADEFINELISDDPHMADAVHTIPNNEVNLVQ